MKNLLKCTHKQKSLYDRKIIKTYFLLSGKPQQKEAYQRKWRWEGQ
jgi:hypothetical protein